MVRSGRKKSVPKKRIRRVDSLKRSRSSPLSTSSSSPMPLTPLSSPQNTDTGSIIDEMDMMQPMDLSMKSSADDPTTMSSLALLANVATANNKKVSSNTPKGRRILSPANSVTQPPIDLSSKEKKEPRATNNNKSKSNEAVKPIAGVAGENLRLLKNGTSSSLVSTSSCNGGM